MYVYQETERFQDDEGITRILYTVGFYRPDGQWVPESDHDSPNKAADRVAYLNGVNKMRRAMDEALNMGNGTYKP